MEIELLPSENGQDRYVIVEKVTAETISPLVKKEISLDGIYEVIDRNFSYPHVAHVGMKFDSRTFGNVPNREFDVKMKKVKVPSNYFPIGGDGLDRRYVFANPDYPANPNSLDVVFMVDQNMNAQTRALIRRNLRETVSKLVAGYTNVRFSIWQTAAGTNTVIASTGETIVGFTYYDTASFAEMGTPDSLGANQTNLFKQLDLALSEAQSSPATNPPETNIANFFFRKSQLSTTDEVGKVSEQTVLQSLWKNTVRKVVYFSGSTPEVMSPETYQTLLNRSREAGIQLYYLNTDPDRSGTRTLRELAEDTGGAKFNLLHDSDSKLQQFCNANFYDSNKIYYGDWDGNFKIAWTDNPAWILYDIITDFNYGLGNHIDSSSVDKWTLYDIGRHCDAVDDDGRFRGVPDGKGGLEPRYTCNIIFFNKDEAYNVLKDIAAIFKGIMYWNTEGFSFFADKKKDPLVYFANTNVKDGLFNYSETAKNKRYTTVEVTYNDKFDNYKTKVEFVEDVDGILNYGLNPYKINAAGCTSRSEARRIGKYALVSSVHETDTVTFIAGLEGVYLQPGDVFGVSDEIRNAGRSFGRILEINETANTIKIDGEFVSGLASGVYIHVPSGNFSLSDLSSLTGIDGDFTGTLEQIRAKRQKQTRKFNIHTVVDDSYGATLTLTGDFLLKSGIFDLNVVEGRATGVSSSRTGVTTLTGLVYNFPPHTVVNGNPKWDTLNFSGLSGVLSDLEIDIDFSGTAGTGQIIANEPNWTAEVSTVDGTVKVNGSTIGTAPSAGFSKMMAVHPNGVTLHEENWGGSVLTGQVLYNYIGGREAGSVIIVTSNGSAFSNTESVANVFANYGAVEVYKIGKDVAGNSTSFGYCAALIKGGYRIIERASKTSNDFGKLLFTYRDLLALSKLQPYYTFVQADFGNRSESNYSVWQGSKVYAVGSVVKHASDTYVCTKEHTSSQSFTDDYLNTFTRNCNIQSSNRNIGLTTEDISELGGVAVGMYVAGAGIETNSRINSVSTDPKSVSFHIDKDPNATANPVSVTFSSRLVGGNDPLASKWMRGNGDGYYSVGLPKDFYGAIKTPITTALTSAIVSGAFSALGLQVHVGGGTLGQSDLRLLEESKLGYSGLVYGTGYPKGIYSLSVDTTPQNLDLINEGSLYVLSGSGVEPKLYKTIATKEEEANQYAIVGIEYLNNKDDYIEKDILDTSPSYYVKGPYDVVVKPNEPSGIQSISGYSGNSKYTGIQIIWSGTDSPITGYKVYVSRPDFSTVTKEKDSIVEAYTIASGVNTLTIPINDNWGQYDFKVYSQGTTYNKLLCTDPVETGIVMLPSATLTGLGGGLITSTMPSGFIIDTADQDSIKYSIEYANGTYYGNGRGNWTSEDLVFRWKYIDPTGGKMTTKQQIYENPFLDLPQEVTLQVLDPLDRVLHTEQNYQGLSYKITKKEIAALYNKSSDPIKYFRQIGLRLIVKDNTQLTKTATFQAVNQYPDYSKIEVIDSFQNSPYQILSGYYGNRGFTGLAVWSPDVASTIGAITTITGSGVRDLDGNLIRSESEKDPLTFRDISGAFSTATFYNGTGTNSVPRSAVSINFKGTGEPDYEKYVNNYDDLRNFYDEFIDKAIPVADWGASHYAQYGQTDSPAREVPVKFLNLLGACNLDDINPATQPNTTGFSGVSFTVLTENVSKGKIIFNCFSSTSNKDVRSVDVYTGVGYETVINIHENPQIAIKDNWYEVISTGAGVNWTGIGHASSTPLVGSEFIYNGVTVVGSYASGKQAFTPDFGTPSTNRFLSLTPDNTRSYLNVITLGQGLPTGKWLYFRFRPWDDYDAGLTSKVVSGWLEAEPAENTPSSASKYNVDGGLNEDEPISVFATSILVKGYKYRIETLGTSAINWVAIGANSATSKSEFIYNGTAITGGTTTPGTVKRVEIPLVLTPEQLNTLNRITPKSDSLIVLPSDLEEGSEAVIVNESSEYNLYIQDAQGVQISTIRPSERVTITRNNSKWADERGSILSVED